MRNFSYTVVDDKIYYRENSRMTPVEVSATAENRIKGCLLYTSYAGQNISVTETSTSFYNERQKVQVSLVKAIEKDKTCLLYTS